MGTIVNGKEIRVTACRDPKEINWGAVGAEYVVESTGLFLTKEKAQAHIEAGLLGYVNHLPFEAYKITTFFSIN